MLVSKRYQDCSGWLAIAYRLRQPKMNSGKWQGEGEQEC